MGRVEVRILAVDPGGTTGWVTYDTETAEFESGQDSDRFEFCERAVGRIVAQVDVVVCEDFRITVQTAKKSQQPDALKIIGTLEYAAHVVRKLVVLQTPGDAKRFSTDARLKKAGLWTPGRRHANDAARHLFLFMAKKGLINALEVDAREG